MSNIKIAENAKQIVDILKNNGFNSFVVGGCVRDMIMGIEPKDFDIATAAKPQEVKKLFNKCIDTGIEHGTVTVVINKEMYEVTTFRIDGDYLDSRKPEFVEYTDSVYEDMLRRDFTMNAIGYNEEDGYIDYFNGLGDIENKIIRGVGEPSVRFNEDALRMLRAIRFSATLDFDIEEETYKAIIEKRELLKNISVERVREEFTKILLSNHNERIEILINTQLIRYYNQEFFEYIEINLESIKEFLKYSKKDKVYVYVALFHAFSFEDTKKHMKALKWDNKTIKDVCDIVSELNTEIIESGYFIRKLVSNHGIKNAKAILFFKEKIDSKNYSKLYDEINLILEKSYATTTKELSISGDDLKSIGITNGKKIGECLKYLLEEVLKSPEKNSKEELLKIAGELYAN